jgi:uncharacterized protein involved in exopolysaccharide biosynthesis
MSSPVANPLDVVELRSASYAGYSLRDLFTTLFYYKRILIVAFLIPCLLGVAAGLLSKTVYVAQARLLLLYGSDYVFHTGNGENGNDIALDRNQIVQGELQIMGSSTLAEETLKAVGLQRVYPSSKNDDAALHVAASRFASDLTVTSIPQSNVIELSFRNGNRDVAADVLRTLIDHYITYRSAIFDKSQPSQVDGERGQFADRLRQAEETLAQFAAAHGISNLDEQASLLLHQKSDNANDEDRVDQEMAEAAAKLDALRREIAGLPQTVEMYAESGRSQENSGLTDMLLKLEASKRDLLSRYQDNFPLVQDIDHQIATVQAQLNKAPSREAASIRMGRSQVYDDLHSQEIVLESQLRGLQARRAALTISAKGIQQSMDDLAKYGQQYRDLQRNRDVLDQSYRTIARTSEETQLTDALERAGGANVRVVQPPDASPFGSNKRNVLMAAGVMLGLLSMAAAFTLLNATKQVFVSVHDAERVLGLQVLAAVPNVVRRTRPGGPASRWVRPLSRPA